LDSASTQITIINKLGLHARPAMSFVDTASSFRSDIKVSKDDQTADGKSIMQLMMLAAPKGTELQIDAEGPDAQQAVAALSKLVASKFDEE
jgi:phosphotransferase system HPr (HPr) family protein